jgi:hypothetical protein
VQLIVDYDKVNRLVFDFIFMYYLVVSFFFVHSLEPRWLTLAQKPKMMFVLSAGPGKDCDPALLLQLEKMLLGHFGASCVSRWTVKYVSHSDRQPGGGDLGDFLDHCLLDVTKSYKVGRGRRNGTRVHVFFFSFLLSYFLFLFSLQFIYLPFILSPQRHCSRS